ncbi:GH92 family glycosyl hydrolase [Pedobacter punctiformis]|uniref:GH92 family glycosyl hydrolase n=1 Tax=Pedobacter punctiformis TaxID=3004097 RepID=A0ABT4L7A6_9SPHI|nr:GH92 family glycosyl hydrolase [Pedobacter sp. HCMS5-2]MCZ4243572.1 GH92 family glycosyl hydrolase [Pedobacter sp. HCMS5-2]
MNHMLLKNKILKQFSKTLNVSLGVVLLSSVFHVSYAQKSTKESLTRYVDPIIGSAKHGHIFVGANVPYGAVQLGPNNIFEGWDWCSGYNYSSNNITGFAHTHLSGTGIGDLGDISIMPATGKLIMEKGQKNNLENGYVSTFSHDKETAKAGYYSVWLDKYDVKAELTATERVGFHQYTFKKGAETPHIMLDLADGIGWDKPIATQIKQIDAQTIVGYRNSKGWSDDQRLYFVIKLSQAVKNLIVYDSTAVKSGKDITGRKLKAAINFDAIANNVLQIKVALSPVSIENAILNLKTELPGWNFKATVQQADAKWEKELQKVKVDASASSKKVFYTALYHTMIAPSLFNDVNKDYRGTDKKVYKNASFNNLTTFSLWDTYRAAQPLYTILHQDKVSDVVNTMLAIYKQQGKLPVWHLMGSETNTMIGYHAVPVIIDAYLKGYRGFDVNLAYEAVKQSAMQKSDGIDYIQQLKFIPADKVNESVAKALEYAVDDYCIAQMAKALNKTEDYAYFTKRAELYKLYFDPQTQFMRGKLANGNWRTPFSPFASKHREDDYTEGNAWQYIWLVPQDVEGLVKLFGSEKSFTTKLDSLFSVPFQFGADSSPDISGLIGNYAQGNEPGHHIPYLYSYVGQPWKTAELIRKIDKEFYTSKPDGLCGNEDVGQMSAWYIFSSMGFYPVNPANGAYVFGSPLLNGASISLPGNKKFNIKVMDNNAENKYIQKIVLNGKPYTKSYILHKNIVAGGNLQIYMGSKPSATFGVSEQDRPSSTSKK